MKYKTYKIVINRCYGGFGLSDEALKRYRELVGRISSNHDSRVKRHDKRLVQVVEELGERASNGFSKLVVEEIHGRIYRINEFDGLETRDDLHDDEGWIIIK